MAAAAKVMTWAGYILGFPTDTPESHRARHRDHQARIADRYPRILLSDAAAGVRGSQGPPSQGGAHGSGHEQLRSRACLRRPSHHVVRDVAGGVYRDAWARYYSDAHVETVLRERAAASGDQSAQDRRCDDGLLRIVANRGRASLQFGYSPAQDPDAAPARPQDRQSAHILSRGARSTFSWSPRNG